MARKSRKQRLAPMPAPSLYVYVALYIRLSVWIIKGGAVRWKTKSWC